MLLVTVPLAKVLLNWFPFRDSPFNTNLPSSCSAALVASESSALRKVSELSAREGEGEVKPEKEGKEKFQTCQMLQLPTEDPDLEGKVSVLKYHCQSHHLSIHHLQISQFLQGDQNYLLKSLRNCSASDKILFCVTFCFVIFASAGIQILIQIQKQNTNTNKNTYTYFLL